MRSHEQEYRVLRDKSVRATQKYLRATHAIVTDLNAFSKGLEASLSLVDALEVFDKAHPEVMDAPMSTRERRASDRILRAQLRGLLEVKKKLPLALIRVLSSLSRTSERGALLSLGYPQEFEAFKKAIGPS